MTENKDVFADYKSQSLTRPRDEAWGNWKTWSDAKIGDKVQGYVADAFYRPAEKNPDGTDAFKPQRGITIKQLDGTLVNLGVKDLSFVLAATDKLRVGDPLTVELDKVLEPTSKARKGAKIFKYYGTNLPENANNPTVKELDDEDRVAGGSAAPVVSDVEEFKQDLVEDTDAF